MMESHDNKGFYLEKSREFPLLEQVITGETTLHEQLDTLMNRLGKEFGAYFDFKDYLSLMVGLGGQIDETAEQ